MSVIHCICCQQPQARYFFARSGSAGRYSIYRCDFCKSAFVWPRPNPGKIDALYTSRNNYCVTHENNRAIGHGSQYYPTGRQDANLVLRQCKNMTPGKNLLDVGAGVGDFSFAATNNGFNVRACEPNGMSRKAFLERNGFEPDSNMFTPDYAARFKSDFHVVIASHVLEHILRPDQFVRNIHRVLDKGGIAAVLVPHFGSALSRLQGKKDMFISPPEHLNFFSKAGLEHLFHRHGLSLEWLETTSKVNRHRLEQLVRVPVFSTLVWTWLFLALTCAHPFKMGMVINAYFRKI